MFIRHFLLLRFANQADAKNVYFDVSAVNCLRTDRGHFASKAAAHHEVTESLFVNAVFLCLYQYGDNIKYLDFRDKSR